VVRRILAAASGVAALATGCSLFADFGGLSKDEIVVVPEAGTSTAADGGGPAPSPTTPPDVLLDAGVVDGGAQGCAALRATFCVDFEGAAPLTTSTWSAVEQGNSGSTLAVTTDQAASPSHSLRVDVPTTPGCVFAGARRELAGTYQHLRARFQVRPDGLLAPFALVASTDSTYKRQYQVIVGVGGAMWTEIQRAENNVFTSLDYKNVVATSPGTWSQVDVDFDVTVKRVTVSSGGQSLVFGLPADAAIVAPYVFFGAWCAQKPTGAYLDDLAIWAE
jgi:hypothetical protein